VTGTSSSRSVRLVVLSVLICTGALLICLASDRYGKGARRFETVEAVGASPCRAVVVDTPTAAFRFWRERGFHGRTILYVGSDWARIDPDEFYTDDPRRHYPLEVYRLADRMEQEFLDDRTFLFVAAEQGVARRVVAVVSPAAFGQARENARRAKNARVTTDSVYVTYHGFPRWFTTAATLPPPDEPVLLYVAASAFRDSRPEEVLATLRRKGVRTDAALLCTMMGDATVTDDERRDVAEFARLLEKGGA
jgi:hypothetical protein